MKSRVRPATRAARLPSAAGRLERAHHRGAHRHHAAALARARLPPAPSPPAPVALRVHPVPSDSSSPRTGRNVPGPTSRVTGALDPPRPRAREQPRGEVQPGGRRGHRARRPRVDRLVASGPRRVGARSMYGGRAAGPPLQRALSDARRLEAHRALAAPERFEDGGPASLELDRRRLESLARLAEADPLGRVGRPDSARARRRRAGRTTSSSALPPVPAFLPSSRAGITLVSFTTSTSPLRSRPGQSRNRRWATAPEARFSTSSREASRSARGAAAMRPSGRSKS